MCGIAGIWQVDSQRIDPDLLHRMTMTLRHRGPDDEGYLFVNTSNGFAFHCGGADTGPQLNLTSIDQLPDQPFNFAFGFRRLAILDLSPNGHQPMSNRDGSCWLIFNGEIYNYIELRVELKAHGHTFRSGSDSEVLLAAYQEWGEACVEKFNGMWAFAIWDSRRHRLFCSRDRFGIKPFYYSWDGKTFAFASEIKALLALGLKRIPNNASIYDYLVSGIQDHTAETFFTHIYQLKPAHSLSLRENVLTLQRYWDLDLKRETDGADNVRKFYSLFEDSIRLHLRSDVPIGTCLSGGLDSSAIVCVTNKLLLDGGCKKVIGERQKTFSSCFDDPRFDERRYIQDVLNVTRAESNLIFPTSQKLLRVLPQLISHQEEPFSSTSIFAQWCVMERVAEKGIKVLLDGQGGDELSAGYHQYFDYYWGTLVRSMQLANLWGEWKVYRQLYGASPLGLLGRTARSFVPNNLVNFGRRVLQYRGAFGLSSDFARDHERRMPPPVNGRDTLTNALYDALVFFSLPALLHYEDRNSMAHSVEARVPFLDYRLVEFLFALPPEQKIKNAVTKIIFRRALDDVLPKSIQGRTDKMGFVTPEQEWFSTELRHWARDILYSSSFRTRGYFDPPLIHQAFEDYIAGKRGSTFLVWRWINLELWFQQFMDRH